MRDNARGGALTEVSFYILLALKTPRHGYGVMQFVKEQTGGRLQLGAGTLYGALTTLTEKGWLAPVGSGSSRKREYQLTPLGVQVARQERRRLEELAAAAREILEG